MITINGVEYPNNLITELEILRSLHTTVPQLRYYERIGLPFIQLDETHIYDPNAVWKWYTGYRRKK